MRRRRSPGELRWAGLSTAGTLVLAAAFILLDAAPLGTQTLGVHATALAAGNAALTSPMVPGVNNDSAAGQSHSLPGAGTVGGVTAPITPQVAPKVLSAPRGGLTQAHYAAPTRKANGSIDIEATLDGIIVRGSRMYQYLIYPRAGYDAAKDWASLPAFLTAARARGVSVEVTLTPPASTSSHNHRCSADLLLPYQGRYDQWMTQIGRLAKKHSNLTAVVMDDYAYSATNRRNAECRSFAPGVIGRWNYILTRQAGRPLKVMPTLYLADLVGQISTYNSIADDAPAIVWPFTSIGTSAMRSQYLAIRKAHPKLKIYVMVYASPFRGVVPTPATLRRELATARALKPTAIVVYQQPLE